tara:strand:+ start:553 stop:750 length:198 start_codon:yes stop_codon:yes gene_type:complete
MSLETYLEELIKKHRVLDEEIEKLEHHHNVTEEVRKLKTQKLWLKDEIHRIQRQIADNGNNGYEH